MSTAQIHGYEILSEIGIGGMSRVYLANDPGHQRQVAIKLLPSEYLNDLGFRARFEQEACLIAALKHPAILPVYEYGVDQGQPFIVMQFMPKGSLADRLLHGPLSPEQAAKILARISSALDYAHSQGIVHRDLKTSNILFDQDDNAFLADFGIALQSVSTWQRNLTSGTPAYMSPEQALRQEAIDSRSDVYSLGIIAFEMLTCGLPFEGNHPTSVVLKQIYDSPPSLGAINPDLPAALDPVLQRALAKEPLERYPSAGAFLEAFQRALVQAESTSPAVDLDGFAPSSQGPGETPLDPAEDAPSEEMRSEETPSAKSTLPARRPDRPVYPDFSFLSDRRPGFRSTTRQGYYYFALGLVTWSAVLLAALTAVMARAQELFPSSNVEFVYDEAAFAVVNQSNTTVDLSGLVFQRLSAQGTITAAFPAEGWDRVNPGALKGLPAGDCFQLLRSGSKDFSLVPGTAPAKPPSCDRSQGWLVASDPAWHFWTDQGEGARFQIVQGERVIHQCRIADGICDFYLPENN